MNTEAQNEALKRLVKEVMEWHRDPKSGEYNECEREPCLWCANAAEALREEDTLKRELQTRKD